MPAITNKDCFTFRLSKSKSMKIILLLLSITSLTLQAQELYKLPKKVTTNWISFENPTGAKGSGGKENKGAKGHANDFLKPGETKVLLDVKGAGVIQRIWMTLDQRSQRALRAMKLEMYWDGETKPAVSVPVGDFFGNGLSRLTPFESALFSNPEGRSFNCIIPMPFKKGARITLTNEGSVQQNLFYDINFSRVESHPADVAYFHAFWNRNHQTKLGEDFQILPNITGNGRFLGCNLGIITDSLYARSWWGEGEVKMYIDGDKGLPTLIGTGTEDYIGTAWGQGAFAHLYQGSPVADEAGRQWNFYRYHIPDPVYFNNNIKVVIQQMGGDMTANVKKLVQGGAQLIPVTVAVPQGFIRLLDMPNAPKIEDAAFPDGWTNFYRLDNYSSTAYFYLDKPASNLPPLAPLAVRQEGLPK